MAPTGQPEVRARPQRTCVGCRARAAASELLRLVVVDGSVTPDLARRAPGRGAHLHPDLTCLELAVHRRAFPRAFRLPGPLDSEVLRDHLERTAGTSSTAGTEVDRPVESRSRNTMTAR